MPQVTNLTLFLQGCCDHPDACSDIDTYIAQGMMMAVEFVNKAPVKEATSATSFARKQAVAPVSKITTATDKQLRISSLTFLLEI
mmetsp:Transcript_71722/g.87945  ORF Transcript_71722/g.87945 Transcript_71722/m.87945 type:complete len:85 (+) Transcript_71722:389-643(+)